MSPQHVRQLGREEGALEPDGETWGLVAQPPRLGDHLSTRIAELIGRGEFDHAGRLPSEVVLANRFGVSRPVVREALSHLRSMGFIVSRKGSGSYIKKPSETAPHPVGKVGFGPSTVWPRSRSATNSGSGSKERPPIAPPKIARPKHSPRCAKRSSEWKRRFRAA